MMDAIAIQGVCCVNKTLALNGFSGYFSRFSVRTIALKSAVMTSAILKSFSGCVARISSTASGMDSFLTPGRVYFCQEAALPSTFLADADLAGAALGGADLAGAALAGAALAAVFFSGVFF